jgi:proline dehydrogenase
MFVKIIKKIIRPIYNNLTAGENIISLQNKITSLQSQSLYSIADYIKESSKNEKDIDLVLNEYLNLAKLSNLNYVAIKCSSLNFDPIKINTISKALINSRKKVLIDAEEVIHSQQINDITNELIKVHNKDFINIYKTYQMYKKDQLNLLSNDLSKFPFLGVKLVRGAYYNQDIHTNQLFKLKSETDESFRSAMNIMFKTKSKNTRTFICTHNKENIDEMIQSFKIVPTVKDRIYHASLYGFIPNETERIIKANIKAFKYLPYGKIEDAIPYLGRRLLENPKILYYLI